MDHDILIFRFLKLQQEEALRIHMAIPHQYAPQAGWVSCIIETKEQVNNTKRLIKQAYDTCASLKTSHKSKTSKLVFNWAL